MLEGNKLDNRNAKALLRIPEQSESIFKCMAVSPDGLTEALYMPTQKFLWAVQWHPEFSYKSDANSRKIFKAFVDAAR